WEIGPGGTAHAVAFSPDGRFLAGGGCTETMSLGIGSGRIMVWDLASREEKTSFWSDSQNILSVAFSHDGKLLASGSWDGKVQLWNTRTSKLKAALWTHYIDVPAVAFSPDGKILAAGRANGQIKLWDMPNAK